MKCCQSLSAFVKLNQVWIWDNLSINSWSSPPSFSHSCQAFHRIWLPIWRSRPFGGHSQWMHLSPAQVWSPSQLAQSWVLQRKAHLQEGRCFFKKLFSLSALSAVYCGSKQYCNTMQTVLNLTGLHQSKLTRYFFIICKANKHACCSNHDCCSVVLSYLFPPQVSSQHPYAEQYIGRPHVITVDFNNSEEFDATIREIMRINVS